jgi:hypothetical protein
LFYNFVFKVNTSRDRRSQLETCKLCTKITPRQSLIFIFNFLLLKVLVTSYKNPPFDLTLHLWQVNKSQFLAVWYDSKTQWRNHFYGKMYKIRLVGNVFLSKSYFMQLFWWRSSWATFLRFSIFWTLKDFRCMTKKAKK